MNRSLLILVLLTAAAYSGLWNAGFVWDDVPLIVQNQALVEASVGTLFTNDLWGETGAGAVASGYFRPLVLLSFMVDRLLFGLSPAGYHFHSLVWHLVAVCALYRLMRPLGGATGALVGATFFALHPVQSEVVSWISARNDLMAAAFGFMALGMVWDGSRPSRSRWLSALTFTVLAALSKETAFVLPFLLVVSDFGRGHREGWMQRASALCLGVAMVLVFRAYLGVGGEVMPSGKGWMLLGQELWKVVGLFGGGVWSPWPLSSHHDLTWMEVEPLWRILTGLGLVGFLIVMCLLQKGEARRTMGVGLAWSAFLLAVTFVPIADKGGFGDRFLYWPLAGMSVILAGATGRDWKWLVRAMAVPAILIIHLRLPDWQHDRSLWGSAIRDVPTSTNELSLGHALMRHDRYKRAHVSFTSSLASGRIDIDACAPLVGSAMRAGMTRQALRMGRWAEAKGCPVNGTMKGWLAMAAALEGEWDEAERRAHQEPPDPKLRDIVVSAAVAKRSGDTDAYAALLQSWVGTTDLSRQVEVLLEGESSH